MTAEKTFGDAVVERLGSTKLDARAAAAARSFKAAHKAYASAHEAANAKEAARTQALASVGESDEAVDGAVNRFADKLVGAGLTTRRAPFKGFSELSPSDVCALAYAKGAAAASQVVRAVRNAKPPKDVLAACDAVDAAVASLQQKLAAYDRPHKEWQRAIAARDALLLDWQKSLTRLRVMAKASLIDDEGAYTALFAAPEGIVIGRSRKKKGKPAPAAPSPA